MTSDIKRQTAILEQIAVVLRDKRKFAVRFWDGTVMPPVDGASAQFTSTRSPSAGGQTAPLAQPERNGTSVSLTALPFPSPGDDSRKAVEARIAQGRRAWSQALSLPDD